MAGGGGPWPVCVRVYLARLRRVRVLIPAFVLVGLWGLGPSGICDLVRALCRELAMSERRLTILFMPESAYGPTNNCIGIGDVLRRRGHRVVFAAEASWRGRLERLGF